jgi:hypothetical protein
MQFEQGFLRLSLGETMSAHDWRDGIGHFCVADYLAELNQVHLLGTLHQSWIYGSYLFGAFGAPDAIDSGFRAQNPPINIRRNNTREAKSLKLAIQRLADRDSAHRQAFCFL